MTGWAWSEGQQGPRETVWFPGTLTSTWAGTAVIEEVWPPRNWEATEVEGLDDDAFVRSLTVGEQFCRGEVWGCHLVNSGSSRCRGGKG